jgi:hypothetical protein
LRVELSEIFEKRTQESFFEKRTQTYQTLKTDFDQKTRVVYQIGIFRLVSVGISWYLPYRYQSKSRSVHFGMIFLARNPISLKKEAPAPFLRKKGAPAPLLIQPALLLRKKGVPAKLVIPTGNTNR